MTGELATVIDDLRSAPALCRPLYAPRPLGFVLTEAGRVLKQIRDARAAGNRAACLHERDGAAAFG